MWAQPREHASTLTLSVRVAGRHRNTESYRQHGGDFPGKGRRDLQGVTQTPPVQIKYDLDASSLGLRLPADDL